MEAWDKPGPGWWMASDRKWYPPELHPDVIGRWWEQPAVSPAASASTVGVASSAVAVLTRPAVHITSVDPGASPSADHGTVAPSQTPAGPAGGEPPLRRPDGGVIDLTRPYPHYPAVWGPVTSPVSVRTGEPELDPFPPLDEPVWADDPRPAPAPTARTTPRPAPTPRPSRPAEPSAFRRAVAKAPVASGALAAVTVAAVGIGGVALMAQAQGSTRDNAAPEPTTSPRVVSVYELDTNMCVGLDNGEGAISDVLIVPCASSHTHRVAAMVAVGTADGAFDSAQILLQATESCGNEINAQGLVDAEYVIIQPSSASWDDGDRRAICLVEEGTE